MINIISVKDLVEKKCQKSDYITIPFYKNGKPVESGKRWGMTLLHGQSMRFRWNETNEIRNKLLKEIVKKEYKNTCSGKCVTPGGECDCRPEIVPLELIHSKIVYKLVCGKETQLLQGDGMITDNKLLMPVVTVADCVPIYFYDSVKGVFGVVHSGWKGTGIIGEANRKAVEEYGCRVEDISVAIGPHIGACCYDVFGDRVNYFTENFGKNCVTLTAGGKGQLSLTEANLFVIKNCGIPEENIVVASDCTCCTTFSDGTNVFGSFRRQAAFLPGEMTTEERSKKMTVQAAFVV